MWIASLTLLVYQCESRSINFTSIIKYYGLSRDEVTYDMNRDVAIAYCGAPYLIKLDFFFLDFFHSCDWRVSILDVSVLFPQIKTDLDVFNEWMNEEDYELADTDGSVSFDLFFVFHESII